MREKLIDLISDIVDFLGRDNIKDLADYLIENGVVIPEEQPTQETVSRELYEQIKWERDTALNQLERIGVSLGEKTDDVVKVVRCEQCSFANKMVEFEDFYACLSHEIWVSKNDFCSYGEPKAKGEND